MLWPTVCLLASVAVSSIAAAEPSPAYRDGLGFDAMVSLGPVVTGAASLRYDAGTDHHRFIARLGGLVGLTLGGTELASVLGHIGYRAVGGRFFLGLEIGGAVIREDVPYDSAGSPEDPPPAWNLWPSGTVTLGMKFRTEHARGEWGVAALFPFIGIGFFVGIDFQAP